MTGFMLGAAMLTASMGLPPAVGTATVAPTTVTFPRAAALVDWQNPTRQTLPEPRWRKRGLLTAPVAPPRQTSTGMKVLAIAAGAVGGFFAGAYAGAAIAHAGADPHDDTSALLGAMIGGAIGAPAGALIAWRLTK